MMAGMNSLHIFKSGTRTDTTGRQVTLTDADLKATVAAYDPAKHEAPIVIGHPEHDAPAWGWAKSLALSGGDLNAEPTQVDPTFAENFNAGRWKKFSASFYEPTSPNNPVPGVWYLRHIGTLGAQPPAVKGMRQASFAEGETGVVCFSDWTLDTQASMWRRLRDWIIGKEGQEVADQIIPDFAVNDLRDESRRNDPPIPADVFINPSFSENTLTPEQIAALQAENERLKKEHDTAKASEVKRLADARHADHVAFAETHIARIKPKYKDAVVAFLDFVGTPVPGGGSVSFGEGDAAQPLGTVFKTFVAELPEAVSFGETAIKERAATNSANPLIADAERRAVGK